MTTRVVLIRHGHSRAIADGIVGGHIGCKGLTDEGRAQAEKLRDRLLGSELLRSATALVASILPRAIETAEIVAPAVGDGTLDVVTQCELCELHVGDEVDGMLWSDYIDRFGTGAWETDTSSPVSPGGESWQGFIKRASDALRDLADQHPDETVVLASHGGVIESSFAAFGGIDIGATGLSRWLRPENTGLTIWARDVKGRWQLERYNDSAHLD